jgi:hypothetical protein
MTLPELADLGATYAEAIVDAVRREYPNAPRHVMTGPDDTPTPRSAHPAFYGCFDWHSAVEMHWALVRLLRTVPGAVDEVMARAVLDEHLTRDAGRSEAEYLAAHPGWERPYGWAWALTLLAELEDWSDDRDAARWAAALQPVGEVVASGFVRWLPRLTYAERVGMHSNTAFALTRSWPYAVRRAGAGDPVLRDEIVRTVERLFLADRNYPAAWEPAGADFLSGALTEAELIVTVRPGDLFGEWLTAFLPGLAAERPASLFTPAVVADPTDGQGAHLYGLNLYRAHAFGALAARLPPDDERVPILLSARAQHAAAALPAVVGGDWMAEHWLAAYAVLLLS